MTRHFLLFIALIFLYTVSLYAQDKTDPEWYLAESNGGLCDQSILLFKDSTYCSESGCEASSHFSYGKWTQKKNLIKLLPADPSADNFINKVERENTNSKEITVIVFDREGNNITSKVSIVQYVKNKGRYILDLDSSKTKRTDFMRSNSTIVLSSLRKLFRQKFEVNTDSSNLYKIYLNIPSWWNFHNNSDWDNTRAITLIKKADRLVSTNPDHFDDKGNLIPTEYIRQLSK